MDRQEFESLSLEKQVAYVNERPQMTLKQIAQEIGIPASTLSQIFTKAGYERIKGIYVKQPQLENPQSESSPQSKDLEELLQHKDQLLMLLKEQQHQPSNQLDFSFLNRYVGNKKTISFDLPEDFVEEIDAFVKATGYKKQSVYALAIYQFMQNYG